MKNIIIFICILIVIILLFIYFKDFKEYFKEYFKKENIKKDLQEYIDLIDKINIRRINQIPVYYINMDKDIDRRQYMESQLPNHFERYYRIPGVNGKLIKNKNHDIVDGIEFFNEFNNNSTSEIGCTLSHLLSIKTAYDNGEEVACIMEDDIYMNLLNIQDESLDDFVKSVNNNLDWEILQLYYHDNSLLYKLDKNFTKIKNFTLHLHQKGKYTYSTVCYIINRKGMETILNSMGNNPFYLLKYMSNSCSADEILYDQVKTYIVNPCFIIPNNTELDSTIHTDHTNGHLKSSLNIIKKYENKIKMKILDIHNIIFSITTSPKRILLMEKTINSILNQSVPPTLIRINIPKIFKRTGESYIIPAFISNNPKIKIYEYDEDYGPIMKVLPTIMDYQNDDHTIIIYGDDDVLTLPLTIENYLDFMMKDSKSIYCLCGINYINNNFNYINNEIKIVLNKVNIVEGYATVCLKSNIIKKSIIEYYNIIKDNKDCFQSDDLILSNFYAMNNINSYQVYSSKANKELWWSSGCDLNYGNLKDALKNLNQGGHFETYKRAYQILIKNNIDYLNEDNTYLKAQLIL
jgi:GR25 family glycosyltransferase involved in LPS biosynthesis